MSRSCMPAQPHAPSEHKGDIHMNNILRSIGQAALAALALSPAACSTSGTTATAPASQAAEHNQDDVDFVTNMAQHHQQALDLAALVPDRSQNDDAKALAAKIHDEQAPEIDRLHALGREFGAQSMASTDMGDMDMSGANGMVSEKAIAQLSGLSGSKFDKRWLGLMSEHHNGAVKMAQGELGKGQNPEVKQIAQNIVAAQTAEVVELGALLEKISADN